MTLGIFEVGDDHIGAKLVIFIDFQYKTNGNPIGNQCKSMKITVFEPKCLTPTSKMPSFMKK